MHRRMRLSLGSTLLLLMFLVGPAAAAESPAEPGQRAEGTFDLLSWAWEWITSLASEAPAGDSDPEGGPLDGLDGGPFTDPNGND